MKFDSNKENLKDFAVGALMTLMLMAAITIIGVLCYGYFTAFGWLGLIPITIVIIGGLISMIYDQKERDEKKRN